jgi:hypothetical protein
MSKENTYHGWTNYETWRVNLEFFSEGDLSDFSNSSDLDDIAEDLRFYVEDLFIQADIDAKNAGVTMGPMSDYALAFVKNVNWYEIASAKSETESTTDETRSNGRNRK